MPGLPCLERLGRPLPTLSSSGLHRRWSRGLQRFLGRNDRHQALLLLRGWAGMTQGTDGWGGVHPGRASGNGSHHPMSPEQNALTAPPNPHTLLFEILSLLVEMLALPEAALEEITKWVGLAVGRGRAGDTEIAPSVLAPVHLFFF